MVEVCRGSSSTNSDCASGLAFLTQAQLLDLGPKASTMVPCSPLCHSLWTVTIIQVAGGHSKLHFFVDTMPCRQLNFLSSSKELLSLCWAVKDGTGWHFTAVGITGEICWRTKHHWKHSLVPVVCSYLAVGWAKRSSLSFSFMSPLYRSCSRQEVLG